MKRILLTIVFTILLTGCGLETLTIEDYYKNDLEDVSEIEVLMVVMVVVEQPQIKRKYGLL